MAAFVKKPRQAEEPFRSGYVSLTGRPNVGKSSLLNAILGEKVAIVTGRQQTTRNRIIGIKTLPNAQIIFVDTPGLHEPRHALGELMVRTARQVLGDVDIVVLVVEPEEPSGSDRSLLQSFEALRKPVLLAVNKTDRIGRAAARSLGESYRAIFPFRDIASVSAKTGDGIDELLSKIVRDLPAGPQYYGEEMVTDQFERFMVSEIIREKIMEATSEEIPYSVAVEVIGWHERDDGLLMISANIYVERDGQKGIIIGGKGSMLKRIGTLARADIEGLLRTRVFLELWVKVRRHWRDDKTILHELGYR